MVLTKSSGGSENLFGSEFGHQHMISIEINRVEEHASPGHSFLSEKETLIRFDMSESQWATHVSSMGMGAGVPVTLRRYKGESIPAIAKPVEKKTRFKNELIRQTEESRKAFAELRAKIEAMKISGKQKEDLLDTVRSATAAFEAQAPYLADRFDEHTEETIEAAKVEIHAHANNVMRDMGLRAMALAKSDQALLDETKPLQLMGPLNDQTD
jgi:hypothetical protein